MWDYSQIETAFTEESRLEELMVKHWVAFADTDAGRKLEAWKEKQAKAGPKLNFDSGAIENMQGSDDEAAEKEFDGIFATLAKKDIGKGAPARIKMNSAKNKNEDKNGMEDHT